MKVIVAGSRHITDMLIVFKAIETSGFKITEIVSGCCAGPDIFGEEWARLNDVPVMRFPADWRMNGKAAGPMRNRAMAEYADALVICWDGKSAGSASMLKEARARKIPIHNWIHREAASE